MKQSFVLVLALAWCHPRVLGQDMDYRASLVDEGTWNNVRLETPLNYQNKILPQATRGNLGTASLFLGYGGLTSSLNVDATTDNLHSSDVTCSLRELSLDLSLTDKFDVTIGKKILKWGPGYAFNPTGVVEPQRSPSDPSDRLGQNEGRKIISATAFLDKNSLTLVYINDAQVQSSKLVWNKQEFALRAYAFIDGFDLSLVGHYKEGDRLEAGMNCAKVIGDNLELHGEFLAKKGSSFEYHQIITTDNVEQIFSSSPYIALYNQSERIFYKMLLGGQYTFENGINITLEYYHDAEGLNKIEWKRWMKFVKFQNNIQQGLIAMPPAAVEASRYNLLWALGTLSPRGAMSDYIFAREFYLTGGWSFECLQFLNAVDFSLVVVPSLSYGISEHVALYGRWTSFIGDTDSEFGALFNSSSFNLGIRFQL